MRTPNRLIPLLLLSATSLWGATYCVAPRGSDENDGSEGTPFATLQKGADLLKAGDTLIVEPGVYRQIVRIGKLHGEPDSPIMIRARIPRTVFMVGSVTVSNWTRAPETRDTYMADLDRGTRIVYERDSNREYVEMAGMYQVDETAASFMYDADRKRLYVHTSDDTDPVTHLIDACVLPMAFDLVSGGPTNWHISLRKHIIIDGFVMAGYYSAGIHVMRGDSCEIRNCVAHHCGAGVFMHSSIRSTIRDCEASWCYDRNDNEGGGIGFRGRDYDNVIADCVVHDVVKYGIRHYGGGFTGCVIRDCLTYRIGRCAIHTKGRIDTARRYASMFSPPPSERPMRVLGNVAVEKARPYTQLFDCWGMHHNTSGSRSVSYRTGMAMAKESQLTFEPGNVAELKFVDPVNHDYRLQSDAPTRGQRKGAFPYEGNVFFVKTGGDDNAAGTSVTTAWGDVSRAVSRLLPGQTLYVLAGAYPVSARINLDGGVVAIKARGEDRVVVGPSGEAPGLTVSGPGRLELQRIRLRGFRSEAIVSGERVSLSVDRCVFEGNRVGASVADAARFHKSVFSGNKSAIRGSSPGATAFVYGTILWRNTVAYESLNQVLSEFNCISGGGVASMPDGSRVANLAAWRQVSGQDLHSIDVEPGLMDSANGDFRLKPTSPCRGRGYEWSPIGIDQTPHHWFKAPGVPKITDVCTRVMTPTMANLTWRSRGGKTTALVRYGRAEGELDTLVERTEGQHLGSFHAVTLFDLEPNTTYYYQIGSAPHRVMYAGSYAEPTDPSGPVWDEQVRSFRTPTTFVPKRRTLHVSKASGSDANDGLSVESPFATVHKAARVAEPGDRVVIHGGEYFGILRPVNSGLPDAPIVFEAAEGERVELSGKRLTQPRSAIIFDKRHIVLRGFRFKEHCKMLQDDVGGGSQFMIGDSTDIAVESCLFDGRMYYMMSTRVFRSADVRFSDNVYYIMSNYTGISVGLNPGRILFDHNTFYTGATTLGLVANNSGEIVFSNNIFGEKTRNKWSQPKFNLFLNPKLAFDYNYYTFHEENEVRFALRLSSKPGVYTVSAAIDPKAQQNDREPQHPLAVARELGLERHGRVGRLPWLNADEVAAKSRRIRGIAPRDQNYGPLEFSDFALRPDAQCRGMASDAGEPGRRPDSGMGSDRR